MKKTAFVTGLVIAMAFTTEVKAGGPPPVCMVVDKIVLEPDEKAPTRIQVWGTFIFCKANATYDRPVSGYLYYTAEKGKEDACRKEWAKLQKLVADKHIVAWGSCGRPKVDGHLREATENPKSPLLFPLGENEIFINGDVYERDFPAAKKLLGKAALRTPKQ
jgi:hypothetical protein